MHGDFVYEQICTGAPRAITQVEKIKLLVKYPITFSKRPTISTTGNPTFSLPRVMARRAPCFYLKNETIIILIGVCMI